MPPSDPKNQLSFPHKIEGFYYSIALFMDRVSGGGGSSRSEIVGVPLDRKCIINDALDKHLEKSSPPTSRVGGLNSSSKDKERLSVPSTSTGKFSLCFAFQEQVFRWLVIL
ncbi:isoform 2 of putative casein kinase ii subunit beta-4 [Fagus crenata]